MRRALSLTLALSLAAPSSGWAWGFEAHKFITSRAIDLLPEAIRPFFQANRVFVVEHSVDPDLWRSAGFTDEPPRHFVDWDVYGTALPRDYNEALNKYGLQALQQNGLLPWRGAEMAGRLERSFEDAKNGTAYGRENAKFFAAVIAHYIGDSFQPFHAALNYDGQLTGQNGIHARFEEQLFTRNVQRLKLQAPPVKSI